jgi:uncharacterized protein (DUF2249 family)
LITVRSTDRSDPIDVIRAHHEQLRTDLMNEVEELWRSLGVSAPDTGTSSRGAAIIDLIRGQIAPHAHAEEDTMYRAAYQIERLRPLVTGMSQEHALLFDLARDIEEAETVLLQARAAAQFTTLFSAHIDKENAILLPELRAAGVDLDDVLGQMHESFRAFTGHHGTESVTDGPDPATTSQVANIPIVVDTRQAGTHSCADLTTSAFDTLAVGQGLLLVADHDPTPLRYLFEAERPGQSEWQLVTVGPPEWQAKIRRIA